MRPRGVEAFTLVELLTVIVIIGVLASIVAVAVESVRQKARAARCMSNLRQLHAGVITYSNDHKGWLPVNQDDSGSGAWWKQIFPDYISDPAVFACPSDETDGISEANLKLANNGKLSYGAMGNDDPVVKQGVMDKKFATFTRPSTSVMLIDDAKSGRQLAKSWYYNWPRYVTDLKAVHDERLNLVYVDGHVASLTLDELKAQASASTVKLSYGDMASLTPKSGN